MSENPYNLRSFHHDYFKPFIYHIIFKKQKNCKDFGYLRGNSEFLPGQHGAPYVYLSPLGRSILNGLYSFDKKYPEFQKFHFMIMPDHIHVILYKKEYTSISFDKYMERFKEMMLEKYNSDTGRNLKPGDVFTPGITDKPLYEHRSLDVWYKYLDANPYRRMKILQNPKFFERRYNLKIGNEVVEAYGNIFLLSNPDKYAVRMRRRFTLQMVETHKSEALYEAQRGSVLVSPFVADAEKAVLDLAEKSEAKLIKIKYEKLGEKYKPARHEFDLCGAGRLLILSIGLEPGTFRSYSVCTRMNELAAAIASGPLPHL